LEKCQILKLKKNMMSEWYEFECPYVKDLFRVIMFRE
jgi:hypothetical protein